MTPGRPRFRWKPGLSRRQRNCQKIMARSITCTIHRCGISSMGAQHQNGAVISSRVRTGRSSRTCIGRDRTRERRWHRVQAQSHRIKEASRRVRRSHARDKRSAQAACGCAVEQLMVSNDAQLIHRSRHGLGCEVGAPTPAEAPRRQVLTRRCLIESAPASTCTPLEHWGLPPAPSCARPLSGAAPPVPSPPGPAATC